MHLEDFDCSEVRRGPVQSVNKQTPTSAVKRLPRDPHLVGVSDIRPTDWKELDAGQSGIIPGARQCECSDCGTIHFLSMSWNRLNECVRLKSIRKMSIRATHVRGWLTPPVRHIVQQAGNRVEGCAFNRVV